MYDPLQMRPLDPPPSATALLPFDFDGTLHHPGSSPPVPSAFFKEIQRLRRERAIIWGVNTGRSLAQTVDGMVESRFPFLPDWIVAREREIYFAGPSGEWRPNVGWNDRCEDRLHGLFRHAHSLLEEVRHLVEESTGAYWLAVDGEPAGIISRTEEEMEWIISQMETLTRFEPQLGWQRNSIYLRFGHRDYQKGSSLSEVARHYRLDQARCFAIGDSHNDLAMLCPAHAAMIACPANAVDDVKHQVASHGGYLAGSAHGDGVIEAMQHFFPNP